ncbi:MAG: hypothetical protein HYW57_09005 [Ignavibacteriales bacterium]|nr:hypothetical protein [Ignavibacteriales bacterium]
MTQRYFGPSDLDRIAQAVRQAERKTSGEIVPYFVEQSDGYEEAIWRGGGILGGLALVLIAAIHLFGETWHGVGPTEIGIILLGGTGLGMMLVRSSPLLRRLLAGNTLLEQRVAQRAAQAFIAEEVFNTRDRTGILLFVSFLEQKVLVVGDSGINRRVKQSEWEDVVARVVGGINSGRPADGLIDAILQCGVLLKRKGVRRRTDDRNELSNRLRVGGARHPRAGRKKK